VSAPTPAPAERTAFTHLDDRLELVGIVDGRGTPCVELRLLHRAAEAAGASDFRETGVLRIPVYLIGRAIGALPDIARRTTELAL
jgi:hypothetical protein